MGISCNSVGKCYCKAGYTGSKCESCQSGYYRSGNQCQPCNCNYNGRSSISCNSVGKCYCKTGYNGRKCESCETRYYKRSGSKCIRKTYVCKPRHGYCDGNMCNYHGENHKWC